MLVIRLFRTGKKNQPSFKIVVADKTKPPRAGRFVEEVGFYNPKTKEKVLKAERIKYWLSVGAKPSPTLHNLLVSEKIVEGKKARIYMKKTKKEAASAPVGAPASQEEKPAAEAPTKEKEPTATEKPAEEKPKEEVPKEEKPAEDKSAEEKPPEEPPKTE